MKTTLLLLSLCFMAASCNSDSAPSALDGTDPQQIDAMRKAIVDSWKTFQPADQHVDTVVLGKGELTESPDGSKDHLCHYLYNQASYVSTWNAPNKIYRFHRDLLGYTLGADTTVPAATCAATADKEDDTAEIGFAFEASIFLYLDKLQKNHSPISGLLEAHPEITTPVFDEIKPTLLTKASFESYDVYRLTYHIKGHASQPMLSVIQQLAPSDTIFEGDLEITFGANTPPSAWVWQTKATMNINGQPQNATERLVLSINGNALPVY